MSWVVIGLSNSCDEYPGHDCVVLAHGPFEHHRQAAEHALTLPEGFRPHIVGLVTPDELLSAAELL